MTGRVCVTALQTTRALGYTRARKCCAGALVRVGQRCRGAPRIPVLWRGARPAVPCIPCPRPTWFLRVNALRDGPHRAAPCPPACTCRSARTGTPWRRSRQSTARRRTYLPKPATCAAQDLGIAIAQRRITPVPAPQSQCRHRALSRPAPCEKHRHHDTEFFFFIPYGTRAPGQ